MEKILSYINGFNDGYIIRKSHPLLYKKLINGVKTGTPYFEGYEAGGNQYEKEIKQQIQKLGKDRSSPQQSKKGRGFVM